MAGSTRANGYADRSRALLAQAKEELGRGDYLQASEKLWGAAAHMVKGVAERRGWRHGGHRELFEAVGHLAQETGDEDLKVSFQIASSLHQNFYESWQPQEYVESSVTAIERLISRLDQL